MCGHHGGATPGAIDTCRYHKMCVVFDPNANVRRLGALRTGEKLVVVTYRPVGKFGVFIVSYAMSMLCFATVDTAAAGRLFV